MCNMYNCGSILECRLSGELYEPLFLEKRVDNACCVFLGRRAVPKENKKLQKLDASNTKINISRLHFFSFRE